MRQVPAAMANREFSRLIREVQDGNPVVITSHGKPVVEMIPFRGEDDDARREAAKLALLKKLAAFPAQHLGKFNRDDAYDD